MITSINVYLNQIFILLFFSYIFVDIVRLHLLVTSRFVLFPGDGIIITMRHSDMKSERNAWVPSLAVIDMELTSCLKRVIIVTNRGT